MYVCDILPDSCSNDNIYKVVEKIKTQIFSSIFFSPHIRNFLGNVKIWYSQKDNREKYMAHALRVPDNEGYRHTLRKCSACCFSGATMVTRKHLIVTCLS
jgi:hypothetical protein